MRLLGRNLAVLSFGLLGACSTVSTDAVPTGSVATDTPTLTALAANPKTVQGDLMAEIHPPTRITAGIAVGEQTYETLGSSGTSPTSAGNTSLRGRLQGEHFFANQFGGYISFEYGLTDDIREDIGVIDSELETFDLFIGPSFRATMDEKFRMPVRVGLFIHKSELTAAGVTSVERSSLGLRLSAEPEVVFVRNDKTEISAFVDLFAGAGAAETENPAINAVDGYAFNLGFEVGVRFKLGAFLVGPSYVYRKFNYDQSEVDPATNMFFVSTDDDFSGFMLTAGGRF